MRFLLLTLAMFGCPYLPAQTLGEVLAAHHVPSLLFTTGELQTSIENQFAQSSSPVSFLLAFYEVDKAGTRSNFLQVVRYQPRTKAVARIGLTSTASNGPHTQQVSNACLGAPMYVRERYGTITLDTHINPSAGCVFVFDSALHFRNELHGWTLGRANQNVIFEGSTIHFVPTHPATVSIYNPATNTTTQLYPKVPDAALARFLNQLSAHLPSPQWCMENNNPCDPARFTSDISRFAGEADGHTISFTVKMVADGFGPDAEKNVLPRKIVYRYRQNGGSWIRTSP